MTAILPLIHLPDLLSDGVVRLDAHVMADAEAHMAGEDQEMRRRFDSERAATLDEMRAAMERWIEGRARGTPMFAYALRGRSGELMGGCELRMLSQCAANVSYWLYPVFRGGGYATRALDLLCRHAHVIEGLARLEAHIAPDNLASRRVAERAAFIESGTVEETAWTGATSTMILYLRPVPGKLDPQSKG